MTAISKRIVVVGAGLMGRGIAHGFATTGHEVALMDVSDTALAAARAAVEDIIAGGVRLGKMLAADAAAAMARLTTGTVLEAAAEGADLVVETVTEALPLKLDIVRRVAPLVAPGAIIATNTSALSVTEIAGATTDPSRVVGMHFFNPVHKMKLLEIVAGLSTSPDALAVARRYGAALGKTTIVVNDSPGLTTSRMSALMGNEAMRMLAEGTASAEDIDTALRLGFNHPMGPLELGDLTGWDTRLKVLHYLHQTLGDRFRPSPLILRMVNAGRIGRKAGGGVYLYDADGRRISGSGLKGERAMTGTVIVEAVRTPIGRYRGGLGSVRADHLGAVVLRALAERSGIAPVDIGDVVFGCVTQVGEQCANIGRTALLGAGWPETIPGMTVDRKCGSSEAAVHVAVGAVASGAFDVVVAGGAENMSRVRMGGNREIYGAAFGWAVDQRFPQISQGEAAERLADVYGFSRGELDDYAIESHRRAALADDAGYFDRETVTVDIGAWREPDIEGGPATLRRDETIRRDTSREKLARLKPSFREDGRVTAGNSSQISDGAAAVLITTEEVAARLGLRPRARIRAIATVGSDPTLMLTGPIAATRRVLARAGMTLDDIDLFEVNEAFAPVPLLWMREMGVSHERLNVNGGAIALGHPLGATGARIMTTLLHELERRQARFGLQAICCAGGLGTATIIERLDH